MKLLLIALPLLLVGCPPPAPPVGPPEPIPTIKADCKQACDNLQDLGCPEGDPTAGRAACQEVCENMPVTQDYLDCAATITQCSQLDNCPE